MIMTRMHFTESLIGLVYPPSNDANLLLTFTVYNLKYSNIEKELFYFFYYFIAMMMNFESNNNISL